MPNFAAQGLAIFRELWFRNAMRTTSPAAPLSNRPTREFRRHHAVEPPAIGAREFRPGWRVRNHLSALLKGGTISVEAFVAGTQWRQWAEQVGHMQVQSWNRAVDRTLRSAAPSAGELRAAQALKEAAAALGRRKVNLLTLALVDARTWTEIGARLGLHRHTVKEQTAEALEALACWRARR